MNLMIEENQRKIVITQNSYNYFNFLIEFFLYIYLFLFYLVLNHEKDESSDEEEEVIKNAISSRGKFASFLYMRNSMIDPQKAPKTSKALDRSSLLLSKTFSKSHAANDANLFMVNPKNIANVEDKEKDGEKTGIANNINNKINEKPAEFKPKSSLTPFLLLIALSLHGFFEGIALGIQSDFNGVLFLGIAILSHKWAEAFTLVI